MHPGRHASPCSGHRGSSRGNRDIVPANGGWSFQSPRDTPRSPSSPSASRPGRSSIVPLLPVVFVLRLDLFRITRRLFRELEQEIANNNFLFPEGCPEVGLVGQ